MGIMKKIQLYTDGSCLGNPGPGGYGAILVFNDKQRELSGGYAKTTNNRMEMLACVKGLEALTEICEVDVTTDSQYVRKGITEWIHNWKKRGWKTAAKAPVRLLKTLAVAGAVLDDAAPRARLEGPVFRVAVGAHRPLPRGRHSARHTVPPQS